MKICFIHMQILVHLHVGKTYFRMTGFALGLALKQRWQATWKPPIPPRFFAPSLAHRTFHLIALSLYYYSAWFLPQPPLSSFSCSTYTPATFPTHTITVFTTQYSPFPSPPHLFPLSPLPHQPPIPYINRTGIPIPVINNEFLFCQSILMLCLWSQFACDDDQWTVSSTETTSR